MDQQNIILNQHILPYVLMYLYQQTLHVDIVYFNGNISLVIVGVYRKENLVLVVELKMNNFMVARISQFIMESKKLLIQY